MTPAAGVSGPIGAMLLGACASLVCYGFVGSLKNRLRLDDSLDVFGIHEDSRMKRVGLARRCLVIAGTCTLWNAGSRSMRRIGWRPPGLSI